jgi:integrase
MPFIPTISVPEKAPEVLPMDVRQYIVDNFVKPVHRPIFGYYAYQGPRPSELISLKWEDIKEDSNGKYVKYQRTMSDDVLVDTTKDKEPRFNPIFPEAEKYLPQRGPAQSWVFTNKGKQYTTSVLRHQLYWAFRRYNKHMEAEAAKQGKT